MFSLKRFVLNCRCQAEIKAKSTVQTPFFEKSAEMQLLNSNIPRRARTTKYSNKKAQDLLNLVLFVFCSFFVLQRWWVGIILKRYPRFGFSCSLKTYFLIILQISPMGGDRFSFQFYPSKILIDYFLISELAFIIHPKIKRPRVVRIVKRRAGVVSIVICD